MANSTSANLKLTVQATGENSGTWGQITNTNLLIVEQAIAGYESVTVNATTGVTLAFTNGAVSNGKNQVVKLAGTITGAINVIIPDSIEKTYIIHNGTSGSHTVTVKTTSGSGVTFAADDKGHKVLYSDGTNVIDTALTDLSSDVSPQLSANLDTNSHNILIDDAHFIGDDSGNEQLIFQKAGSAVNNLEITNAASGSHPSIASVGDDTNINFNIIPKGTGVVQSDGTAVNVAGKQTIFVPAVAMYPRTTTGCADLAQTELTVGRPELKSLDFDASTDEFAQFAITFPKSWNEGTITYQPYFTANTTNTGTAIFGLQGVAISDNDAIDTAFGTAQTSSKAHSGTINDLDVGPESSAITIAGTPAAGDEVFFQIFRDADNGSDTLNRDAKLLGIKVFFTTDAANDA
mgnify:CR=1 FL=1